MTARGDNLGCSRNPGSNYYTGLTHQLMIDLGADDVAKVSGFIRCGSAKPVANYYEAVRPSPAHRYFRPHGFSRLCLFPWHRRPGSHVPYESPNESHASSTPDATWTVSRIPSMLIPEVWHASGFDVV